MDVLSLQLGPIGTNCYLLVAPGGRAVLVDPGDEAERVLSLVRERDADVEAILVTHCHYDHVGAVAPVARELGAPVWMSGLEAPALEQPERFRMPGHPSVAAWQVDHPLDGGERITVAGIDLEVLSVPGHSPGHLAFLLEPDGAAPICFIGDVIFRGSVGRTDLPFADGATLTQTLRELARRLAPETILLPGHGEPTTMQHELASNPFLRERA